jgi:hypothetical protein
MYSRSHSYDFELLLSGLLLMACQSEIDAAVEPVALKAAVVGGKEVSVCQYPSTVRVEDCTGTLIHPRVVTTAAHCVTDGTETIRFGGGGGLYVELRMSGTLKRRELTVDVCDYFTLRNGARHRANDLLRSIAHTTFYPHAPDNVASLAALARRSLARLSMTLIPGARAHPSSVQLKRPRATEPPAQMRVASLLQ